MRKPWIFLRELLYPVVKLKTLFKLTSRLLFFPWASPWMLLVLVAVLPAFFQSAARPDHFHQLTFYYGAAVLPFLFLAFADGWRRLRRIAFFKNTPWIEPLVVIFLIFLNGMNLRPLHFTADDLKTISLARQLPKESIVTTQGHLLPYLGYRTWNFYLSPQYQLRQDTREVYLNPDYYFFDFDANAYPLTRGDLLQKGESLKRDPRWQVIYEDHRRLLLKRSEITLR